LRPFGPRFCPDTGTLRRSAIPAGECTIARGERAVALRIVAGALRSSDSLKRGLGSPKALKRGLGRLRDCHGGLGDGHRRRDGQGRGNCQGRSDRLGNLGNC